MPQAMYLEDSPSGTHWQLHRLFLDTPVGLSADSYSIFVFADGTYMGHLFTGDNTRSQWIGTGIGTVTLGIRRNDTHDSSQINWTSIDSNTLQKQSYIDSGTISRYAGVNIEFYMDEYGGGIHAAYKRIRAHLPEFSSGAATYFLDRTIFGSEPLIRCRTFTESSYATLACGLMGTWSAVDSVSMVDGGHRTHRWTEIDNLSTRDSLRRNPWQIRDRFYAADFVTVMSSRHATITDWQFAPDYRVMFDSDRSGTYATTNWNSRITTHGNITRSIKHWSGDFQVGNWSPTFADPDNELYGSLYGSDDARMKNILITAMINDRPLTYIPQFSGAINRTEWIDGQVTLDLADKMLDLPNRTFVWDYANIGTVTNSGQYGVVKKIIGTDVMIDDKADINWIQRTTKGKSIFQVLAAGAVGGVGGFFSGGGWIGAGLGFTAGFFSNVSQMGDKIEDSYYEVKDYNLVPDDMVSSGQLVKFYSGSTSGNANNSRGPLYNIPERSIKGGTFIQGWMGTLSFASSDINGIKIGDYIYIRKPIILTGSPDSILKALLTGSNIDKPYNLTDFASNWNSQISIVNLFSLGKILENTATVFTEVKELCSDLQLSFYINESNKFTVKSVKPKAILNNAIATYTEGVNILKGFRFTREIDNAKFGYRIYYNYVGSNTSAFDGGFNNKFEYQYPNPLVGITDWTEIQSKWIHSDEDAKTLAWRAQTNESNGWDKVEIPTTLYGVPQSITDCIRVTHTTGSLHSRLFEIEGYTKDFGKSNVTLTAIDAQRLYGFGLTRWSGTTGAYDGNDSGYSYVGVIGSPTTIGVLNGTMYSWSDVFPVVGAGWSRYVGHYVMIGSNATDHTEIIYLGEGNVQRAQFNTISRTYFTGEPVYDLGINPSTNFRFATVAGIQTNLLGTSLRFF